MQDSTQLTYTNHTNLSNTPENVKTPSSPTIQFSNTQSVMDGVILESTLENDSDITNLSQQLLTIVHRCIPTAVEAYAAAPKKSNADALNLFVSQSRELANDLRSLHNKKIQTNKILKECLTPAFQRVHDQMLNIPHHLKNLTPEEYEAEMKNFMTLIVKQICEKLKEIL